MAKKKKKAAPQRKAAKRRVAKRVTTKRVTTKRVAKKRTTTKRAAAKRVAPRVKLANTKLANTKLASTKLTGSQTVGPFFRFGLIRPELEMLWKPGVLGQRILIVGRVTDGKGTPVPDAMIEIWQADADGHYAHPADQRAGKRDHAFAGFGRSGTDGDGMFHFDTIKPGPVPGLGNATQAPHLEVSVFARGMLDRVITRLYFPDEALNAQDPVLSAIKDEAVRRTLVSHSEGGGAIATYVFDIRLQGEGETAFFDA